MAVVNQLVLAWLSGFLPKNMQAQGTAVLHGQNITAMPPEKRSIGTLFQEDRLFPHLTVLENLQFALPRHYKGKKRVYRCLETSKQSQSRTESTRLSTYFIRWAKARVNLLRSLLAEPQAILLDEPWTTRRTD